MDSSLRSLVVCDDDSVIRVLRRVLSEMEIGVEQCGDPDTAIQKLTRQRFEAVIVDSTRPEVAKAILKSTRSAAANKRAITVAVLEAETAIDSQTALKSAFAQGAHFVLFKPLSLERTRSSFRAVRALMKRERRRHARIPIQLPVDITSDGGQVSVRVSTVDLGENGIAIKNTGRKLPSSFQLKFTLPGTSFEVASRAEVAWEGNQILGLRFCDLGTDTADQLKQWVARQLVSHDAEELPVTCKLTDLSLSACYLQTESPFPVRTRLRLMMKVGELALQIEGMVRVMHPGAGMGVEFTQNTLEQHARVEEFIQALVNTNAAVPELQVRPEGIDNGPEVQVPWQIPAERNDPLLSLFRSNTDLSPEVFQMELRKQRGRAAEPTLAG